MSWIPNIPTVIMLFKRIEEKNAPMRFSTKLFWLFCTESLDPEQSIKKITETKEHIRNKLTEFIDPDVDAVMRIAFENQAQALQIVLDRLEYLIQKRYPPYEPDVADNPIDLYVYLNLLSTRLVRLLKTERFSERSRETLHSALNILGRLYNVLNQDKLLEKPWILGYGRCLELLRSFLYFTQFRIQKLEGEYELALQSLLIGLGNYRVPSLKIYFPDDEDKDTDTYELLEKFPMYSPVVPWLTDFTIQEAVNCFEAIRSNGRIENPKNLATICERFEAISTEPWLMKLPVSGQETWLSTAGNSSQKLKEDSVEDKDGYLWQPSADYWKYILGWAEAQLQPPDFKVLFNAREDGDSEQRLIRYFFDRQIWSLIPKRARDCLISLDRDWYSGTEVRIEAILNDLKIASEEILLNGLWNPMDKWIEKVRGKQVGVDEFLKLKQELMSYRWAPDLNHFEQVCKMAVTKNFLNQGGISATDQDWFSRDLVNSLSKLRLVRNRAEHSSATGWTRDGIKQFVNEFLGVGQPGVLVRLTKILF
jgi:hypothetical protein